jgi:hypothetical protein
LTSIAIYYVAFDVFSQGGPEIPLFDEGKSFGSCRMSSVGRSWWRWSIHNCRAATKRSTPKLYHLADPPLGVPSDMVAWGKKREALKTQQAAGGGDYRDRSATPKG